MLISKISIIAGGVLSLFMVLFHCRFYKLFGWKKDFESISIINRKVFYTIHITLLLLFLSFAIISFIFTEELSQCCGLACAVTLSYSLFWLWRTIWQIIYFRPPRNSKPDRKIFLHYILIFVFTMLFIFYLVPFIIKIVQ